MSECFKCGLSGAEGYLYDAIASEGVVKICRDCSFDEGIPIVKKPVSSDQEKAERQLSESNPVEFREKVVEKPIRKSAVYERLMKMSGLAKEPVVEETKPSLELVEEEQSLRSLVEENVKEAGEVNLGDVEKFVENFHWKVMRGRRAKKLTSEQLAKDIAEPEEVIKMLEAGKVPSNYDNLVKKIEAYLGVEILKKPTVQQIEEESVVEERQLKEIVVPEEPEKVELGFDEMRAKQITIADLQEAKNKKEREIFEVSGGDENEPEFLGEKQLEKEVKEMEESGLSEDDINDLIFGK
jgi:ribosome-binding protein aMBF1 (putative translation factor)